MDKKIKITNCIGVDPYSKQKIEIADRPAPAFCVKKENGSIVYGNLEWKEDARFSLEFKPKI